jgi:hypothetical protein
MNRAYAFLYFLLVISAPLTAAAQDSEAVGIRAQGMGGAFTAVADDSTASWWNPAGLASGPFFNLILEASSTRQPGEGGAIPAWRGTSRGFSIAYPALALSYYRLRVSEIQPVGSTAGTGGSREDTGAESVRLRSLIRHQFGATVGQSLGAHFVLASTLKLVRAGAAADVQSQRTGSIEAAEEFDPGTETHAGMDVGAMARLGVVTLGLTVRNATQPRFGEGDRTFTLARHARAGVAVSSTAASATITVDADLDLTRSERVFGEERRFGAGAEVWMLSRRVGLRGGVSGNTLGRVRATPSGGISVALRPGMYVDAHLRGGTDDGARSWGSALRVTF